MRCENCGGRGTVENDCTYCGGDGTEDCTECGDCSECGGSGYEDDDCEECDGSGRYQTKMTTILSEIWHGFWQGIGVELSFFALWAAWTVTHAKLILNRVNPAHWIHKVAEYFE
jgi:hypothetical protein